MRELAKSVFSYALSSSLFSLQEAASLLTPQGWRQTGRAAESFEKIAKVTAEEMGQAARGTFKFGDDMQRRGLDMMFSALTLGAFNRAKGEPNLRGGPAGSSAGTISNMGEQAGAAFTQGLEAASQTVGIIMQSMTGMISNPGCGGARSGSTGWGPVPPPPGSQG
jgi:hypothetical protein